MLGELTDETNQGLAFSYLPLAWSTGSVVGYVVALLAFRLDITDSSQLSPIIGGYLSNPAKHFPSIFGGSVSLSKSAACRAEANLDLAGASSLFRGLPLRPAVLRRRSLPRCWYVAELIWPLVFTSTCPWLPASCSGLFH